MSDPRKEISRLNQELEHTRALAAARYQMNLEADAALVAEKANHEATHRRMLELLSRKSWHVSQTVPSAN